MEGYREPLLTFDNLLPQLTELRKTAYLLDYQFIIKKKNNRQLRNTQVEEMDMVRQEKWASMPSGCSALPAPPPVQQPGSSLNPSMRIFMKASLWRHN